jgi:hypothetical protein
MTGAQPEVLLEAKLGAPLSGRGCRSTRDLRLWAHVPRRGVTIPANSDSEMIYGCWRLLAASVGRVPWGFGAPQAGATGFDEKGEVQTDAEDGKQSNLEIV